jgi:glycosyltransferase 2 family protein
MIRQFMASPWARTLATALLLGILFFTLDAGKLADAIFRIDPLWMAAGAALGFLFVALRMLKWVLLAGSNGLRAPWPAMLRCMLFALALGIVTPGRVGEAIAVMPFAPETRSKAIMTYIYDRVGELCTIILFCSPAAFLFIPVWGGAVAIALAMGASAVMFIMNSRNIHTRIAGWLPGFVPSRVLEILKAPVRIPPVYWPLSAVTYIVTYASIAAFIAGAEPIKSFGALSVLPVVTLSNVVTITLGGLGIREGLAALVSPTAGLTPEVAAGAFFLSFFWTRLLPGVAGAIWTMASGSRT